MERRRPVVRGVGCCAVAVWLASVATPVLAQSGGRAVDEVMVTARKTPEELRQAPLSVTVYAASELADGRAVRLSDLKTAPGFAIEKAIGVDTVFIRGVGGGGRNIGFGARVGVYVDGVFIGQVGALNPALTDVARVEILSGPQGTLFGRNAVAGAVSITSAPPNAAAGASAQVRLGARGDRGFQGKVEGAVSEALSAKLSLGLQHRDGFIVNLRGGARLGGTDLRNFRAALRIQPSERWVVDLAGDLNDDRSTTGAFEAISGTFGQGALDPEAPARDRISQGSPYGRANRSGGLSAVSVFKPNDAVSLTWIFGDRQTRADRVTDNDYSALDILTTRYHDRFDQISNEIRASGAWRRVSYVVGVTALSEKASADRLAIVGPQAQLFGLGAAAYAPTPLRAKTVVHTQAAFASMDIALGAKTTLNLGIRGNDETRKLWFDLDGSRSGAFDIGTVRDFRESAHEWSTTPTASLLYQYSPALNLYARYARGFKSGGWNLDFLSRAQLLPAPGSTRSPFSFRPESVTSEELGARFVSPEQRLSASLTVFAATYHDYQVNQFSAVDGRTVIRLTNAAVARANGVEIAARVAPAHFLVVSGNLNLLDAVFGDFARGGANGVDASGNRLQQAPKVSGAVNMAFRPPLTVLDGGLEATLSYRYRSRTFAGQENTPDQEIARHATLDGSMAWCPRDGRFSTVFWVENLTNDRAMLNRARDFLGTQTAAYAEPRRFGVTLAARL